jgi:CRISPR-associated protein Csd1
MANAILAYFSLGIPKNTPSFIDIATVEKATLVFQMNGLFIGFDDVDARQAWDKHYEEETEEQSLCLVTGRQDTPEFTHATIKLYGGQSSGSYLISANQDSFTSYGKTTKQRAADVGRYSAFAYTTALNALLRDEKHRKRIGNDTLVYWAEKGGECDEEFFGNVFDPPKVDEDAELNAAIEEIARGSIATDPALMRKFHLLCLSPNAARISIRFFLQCEFGDLIRNIKAHYDRLAIASDNRTPYRYLPMWLILSETTVTGTAGDAIPLLGGQLLRSVLVNNDYPLTLYNAILTRIRAGAPVTQTKAAVIKAILIQNKIFKESEVTTVSLNENSSNQPYVLGRLFATLEQLQRSSADGALNRTIYDSYFTSACMNPASVFSTILRLSSHHMSKLRKTKTGYAVTLDRRIAELMDSLGVEKPFPASLNTGDQGRFILGYYHQKAFKKSNNEEDLNDEQ